MPPFKVIIIGGGLAGNLLANGLVRHGIEFAVYERDAKDFKREGYQIRLGSAALIGFRACLEQSQVQELMKLFGRSGGLISSAPILYDTSMNCLLDLTKFPAYTKSAPINRVILRDFLAEPIYRAKKLQYSKKFTKYSILDGQGKNKSVRVSFDDGTIDQCDLLISAEGSTSRINTQLGVNNIVQLTEKWGFLAKSNLPTSKLLSLTPEVQKAPVACIMDGVVLFFSAYMPDAQDGSHTDDTSTGRTTHRYDERAASVFWGLSVPTKRVPSEGASAITNKLEFCLDQIRSWNPKYHDMLKVIDNEDDIYVFQARASTKPSADWRQRARIPEDPARGSDRVWLMGDAIHPMLPARGMGGNQAMQDCADILPCIKDLSDKAQQGEALTDADFSSAVKIYEDKMLPRAFGWVDASGGVGREMMEPSSFKGKIMLFFVARGLDLAYLFSVVRRWWGWTPTDDAPELPN